MFKSYFAIILLVGLLFISCYKEQNKVNFSAGDCTGTVVDQNNNPIPNAVITIGVNVPTTTTTDANGRYSASNIQAGDIYVIASASKYLSDNKLVSIVANTSTMADFKLHSGTDSLAITPEIIRLQSPEQTTVLKITSNTKWTVSNMPSWLILNAPNNQGGKNLTINVSENKSDTARTASIIFSTGAIKKIVRISQNYPVKLLSAYPNGGTFISDSVSISFNQYVKVFSITPKLTTCLSETGCNYFNNNRGIKFHYGCGVIGSEYSFTIVVTNIDGVKSSFDFAVQYYTRKFDYASKGYNNYMRLEQIMDDGFWTSDGKNGLGRNTLTFFNLIDLTPLKEYKFEFTFHSVGYNPVDKYFYIPADNSQNIYVVNPANGGIVRKITLTPVAGDSANDPQINNAGGDIKFFTDGRALIQVMGKSIFNAVYKVLDANNGDKVSNISSKYNLYDQSTLQVNYDGTKIYTHDYNAGLYIYMIDSKTLQVSQLLLPIVDRIGNIKTSNVNDDILVNYGVGNFIWNPVTGYRSANNQGVGLPGFTNRPGYPREIYTFKESPAQLWIKDLSTSQNFYTFPTRYSFYGGMADPYATKDGKYLIAFDTLNSYIWMFDTKCFSNN